MASETAHRCFRLQSSEKSFGCSDRPSGLRRCDDSPQGSRNPRYHYTVTAGTSLQRYQENIRSGDV
jgi:hypothetical protein